MYQSTIYEEIIELRILIIHFDNILDRLRISSNMKHMP